MTRETSEGQPLFTQKEMAAKLNMTVKALMGHVRAGRIRYINIGNGEIRKRYRFTTSNMNTFIEKQKVRETPVCPSTSGPTLKHTASISSSKVVGFTEILRLKAAKKPKPPNVN